MTTRSYEIIDRHGKRRIDYDGDEVLADGEKLVVPLMMTDAAQREVVVFSVQDAARRANYILDQETRRRIDDVREAAYQDMKSELQQAWRAHCRCRAGG